LRTQKSKFFQGKEKRSYARHKALTGARENFEENKLEKDRVLFRLGRVSLASRGNTTG